MTRGTVVQRVYALDGSGNSHLMGVIQRFGPDEQGATGADLFRSGPQSPFDSLMYDICLPFQLIISWNLRYLFMLYLLRLSCRHLRILSCLLALSPAPEVQN